MIAAVNELLGHLTEAVLPLFDSWSPLAGVAVASFVTAIGVLAAFKATSNQAQLAATRRRIRTSLFEIRLFGDDVGTIPAAVADIFRQNLLYLRWALVPMLWVTLPLVILIAQLQAHYGYDGLHVGHPAVLKVQVHGHDRPQARLHAPSGVRVETAAVWIPALREVAWRILPERDGDYELTVTIGEYAVAKAVRVSGRTGRRSPVRLEPGVVNQLLYPAEPPLPPDAPIRSVSLAYPTRTIAILGWRAHWLTIFVAAMLLFTVALRHRMRVVL